MKIMKRMILLSVLLGTVSFHAVAQDDLYFYPTESKAESSKSNRDPWSNEEMSSYYSGINKSSDEYNRRGMSTYRKIGTDSLGNDIIRYRVGKDSFVVDTVYSNLLQSYDSNEDDFAYSRRMGRFDGYWGRYNPWYMGSPYYYSYWDYYDPWYADMYAPWYRGYYGGYWYGGWVSPWAYRYRYWGWNNPYYYGYWGGYYPYYGYTRVSYNGHTGTANHWASGRVGDYAASPRAYDNGNSNFSGYRGERNTRSFGSNSAFGNRSNNNRNNVGSFGGARRPSNTDAYRPFNGTRSNTHSQTYTPRTQYPSNTNNRSSFGGNSSFGGSRSFGGGGSFGGNRSGGGSFGGSRNSGSFGGHR